MGVVIINNLTYYGPMPLWAGVPLTVMLLGTLAYVLYKYPPWKM